MLSLPNRPKEAKRPKKLPVEVACDLQPVGVTVPSHLQKGSLSTWSPSCCQLQLIFLYSSKWASKSCHEQTNQMPSKHIDQTKVSFIPKKGPNPTLENSMNNPMKTFVFDPLCHHSTLKIRNHTKNHTETYSNPLKFIKTYQNPSKHPLKPTKTFFFWCMRNPLLKKHSHAMLLICHDHHTPIA